MAGKAPFEMPAMPYAGDLSCKAGWEKLTADPRAVLVDVRTKVEWQLIGKPDLESISRQPIYLQWVTMEGINKNFVAELEAALAERGVDKDAPVLFMCQSGGRSKMAAMQCTELGYQQAFNLADGFEGELDEHKHRNSISGWKFSELPWAQS